ncbi:MAG: hypothetical protein ACRC6X_04635 [Culicoidibacterales bacterium]
MEKMKNSRKWILLTLPILITYGCDNKEDVKPENELTSIIPEFDESRNLVKDNEWTYQLNTEKFKINTGDFGKSDSQGENANTHHIKMLIEINNKQSEPLVFSDIYILDKSDNKITVSEFEETNIKLTYKQQYEFLFTTEQLESIGVNSRMKKFQLVFVIDDSKEILEIPYSVSIS